jgi:anti-sigma factor RsiW
MEDEILRSALAPGSECLSTEQLGRYADGALGADDRTAAAAHLERCVTCRTELALMQEMTSAAIRAEEMDLVREGTTRLEQRSAEVFAANREGTGSDARPFRFGAFPLAAFAAVVLMVVAASSFYFLRQRAPELPGSVTTGGEVTRSLAVTVRAPVGDQQEPPQRFEWLAVDRAVRYRVRLLEVDRSEVWSAVTPALEAELPVSVRATIAPGRTLLWDVTAYDAAGAAVSESGLQSFRVVPPR